MEVEMWSCYYDPSQERGEWIVSIQKVAKGRGMTAIHVQ